jgi:5-methylcytosine-specific restriction endonuclease McrA
MAEWFENTPRRKLTAKERATIFMKANGVCAVCSMQIAPGQDWEVEHPTPLWASGSDDGADLAPVHRRCHQAKTRREASQRALRYARGFRSLRRLGHRLKGASRGSAP